MERPRLLVVDDDSYTRIGLKTLFTGEGWLVATAGTIAEALALLDPAPRVRHPRPEAARRRRRGDPPRDPGAVAPHSRGGLLGHRRPGAARGRPRAQPRADALEADRARPGLPALRLGAGGLGLRRCLRSRVVARGLAPIVRDRCLSAFPGNPRRRRQAPALAEGDSPIADDRSQSPGLDDGLRRRPAPNLRRRRPRGGRRAC